MIVGGAVVVSADALALSRVSFADEKGCSVAVRCARVQSVGLSNCEDFFMVLYYCCAVIVISY